jgi:predicted dehydrogenase
MTIRFGVIGLTHGHVTEATRLLLGAGAELAGVYSDDAAALAAYTAAFPQARAAPGIDALLEDESLQLIVGVPRPDERAPLGIRVMQSGKDYLADKPGFTTLEQLAEARRVQQATGRKYVVFFSERFANPATVKAAELVQAGAIGRVIQTIGLGPHRLNPASRAAWFFTRKHGGGLLNDLASHQIDQFLYFTGSTAAEIVTAQLANHHHPQYPDFDDFGDVLLRNDRATGYVRVDWLTADGLGAWGDVRLFLLGTEGTIELRKIVDVAGRPGGNHLFLVNGHEQRYIDCSAVPTPFAAQLIQDVLYRTETVVSQAHTFLASELALIAQAQAARVS